MPLSFFLTTDSKTKIKGKTISLTQKISVFIRINSRHSRAINRTRITANATNLRELMLKIYLLLIKPDGTYTEVHRGFNAVIICVICGEFELYTQCVHNLSILLIFQPS
jgi:hypothetical protein